MTNKQQDEALDYFKAHAEDWKRKTESSDEYKVNTIEQRNGYVLKVLNNRFKEGYMLDVGCGTGNLVCDAAQLGIEAVGVDYAQEMIDFAIKTAQDRRLRKANFECCSIFDFNLHHGKYNIISANGFIEYISQDDLNQFLDLVSVALAPRGSFVVGSRNRLFNIFSNNAFTLNEIAESDFELLLKEAIALASGVDIEKLIKMECAALQKSDTKHEKTGIDVQSRFQYTPVQLIHMLSDRDLKPVDVYPIHIHGEPPTFKNKRPAVHAAISNLLQTFADRSPELIPISSSFMLHVQKAD